MTEGKALLELPLCLAGKSHDDISPQRDAREHPACRLHGAGEGGTVIGPPHATERRVRAGLQANVQEGRYAFGVGSHDLKQLHADVRWLDRTYANATDVGLAHEERKQARKAKPACLIAADVDAREDHLGTAPPARSTHATHDLPCADGACAASGLPHDAVAAPPVAAILDLDAKARATRRRAAKEACVIYATYGRTHKLQDASGDL